MQNKKIKEQTKKKRSGAQASNKIVEKDTTVSCPPNDVVITSPYQRLFLQSVIDGVTDPILVVGVDFHIKLMNTAARAFSQGADEASSPKCHQFMFGLSEPCEGKNRSCPLSRVKSTRVPVTEELIHVFPNGKTRIFEILASPMLSDEGEFLGIVESLRDITIRRNYENHLLKDHDKLEKHVEERTADLIQTNASLKREILDRHHVEDELLKAKEEVELVNRLIPSAIFTVDTGKKITSWNDKAEALTGFSSYEIIGKECSVFSLYPCTEVCGVFSPEVKKPIKGKECAILTKKGEVRTISKNADMLYDRDGRVIGAVESFEDITDMKQVAEELRTERDKFKGMLTAVGQGMHIVNRDYTIEYQNDVLRDDFGDKIGEKCYAVYKHRTKPCDVCAMHKAIETKSTQRTEVIMANGKYYEQSYAPYVDVDGESKVLIVLRDISDEKAHQAETMRAGQLASVGELAAGVAHEINNPINGIINYAQILLDENQDNPSEKESLDRIIREGERVATIVNNLLSFSRQQDEERDKVYVADVIHDSIDLLKHQLFKNCILLDVKLPEDLPPVYVNHQQLQQVFLNLLSNARYALNQQYPGKDSRKRLIIKGETKTHEKKPFVRITVTDHGTGVPPEIADKIFDPFFSSKKPGEGTGLGLSISHGIVKNFDGFMYVKSEQGKFTDMIVELPVYIGE
jgi:PAS domain S-box-containing protein